MPIEYKYCKFADMENTSQDGTFKGYASVYENVDLDGDIIKSGAFEESARRSPSVKILKNHNMDLILGSGVVRSDDQGLYIEAQLNLDVARVRDDYSFMKKGILDSMSIGFVIPDYKTNITYSKEGNRQIHKGDIMEVSVVSIPANPKALIQSVKSLDIKSLQKCDTLRDVEHYLRDAGLSRNDSKSLISIIKRCSQQEEMPVKTATENEISDKIKCFIEELKNVK